MNTLISPTHDWKKDAPGKFHWAVFDENWRTVSHGFVDTFDKAEEMIEQENK